MKQSSIIIVAAVSLLFVSCGGSNTSQTTINGREVSPEVAEALARSFRDGTIDTSEVSNLMEVVDESQWTTITDEQDGYKIRFPYPPQPKEDIQSIDNRKIKWRGYTLNTQRMDDKNLGYSISVSSDNALINPHHFEQFVKDQITYLKRATNSILETDMVLQVDGGIGREQLYSMKEGDIQVKYRIILKSGRLFLISVITEKEQFFNTDIKRFFDSLEFLTTPQNGGSEKSYM